MSRQPFTSWPMIYMESVGDLSKDTWEKGILSEIRKRGAYGGHILDLGGGNGIGSDLLSTIGPFKVTALDRSPEMLSLNKTAHRKVVGDFTAAKDLQEKFDYVVSGFDSFNYLDPSQMPSFFSGIERILSPDGLIIFDYSSPKFLSVDWGDAQFSQNVAGGRLDWKTKFERPIGRCSFELNYWKDGEQEWSEVHYQYAINAYQIQESLVGSGLTIESVRNLSNETFSPQTNTHVYVIRRDLKSESNRG